MKENEQEPFLAQAKKALDTCEAQTPPAVKQQLDEIRRQALQQPKMARNVQPWVWWPMGGVAAAVLVVMFWFADPQATQPDVMVDDLELLSAEEDLALMEEIEFMVWLLEQADGRAG